MFKVFKVSGTWLLVLGMLYNSLGCTRETEQAEQTKTTEQTENMEQTGFIPPPLHSREGPRRNARPGLDRTPINPQQSLIGLVPTVTGLQAAFPAEQLQNKDLQTPLVMAERTAFWFYVPQDCPQKTPECSLQFEVLDHNNRDWRWTQSQIWQKQDRLVVFRMPQTGPALQVGQVYRWRLKVLDAQGKKVHTISGDFERGEPTRKLQQDLDAARSPRKEYLAYGRYGAWFEKLNGLMEQYALNPGAALVRQDWQALLPLMEINCDPLPQQLDKVEQGISISCQDKKQARQ